MFGELASAVHGPMGGLDSHQSHWPMLGVIQIMRSLPPGVIVYLDKGSS